LRGVRRFEGRIGHWFFRENISKLWSFILWDEPMLPFSDNFVGGQDMTTYINQILQEKLGQSFD
jgi:hypothetical protein